MLANGSELVGRDPHYQAASLDQRRQEIEKRIDNLEGRIAGARKYNLIEAVSRESPQQIRPQSYQFTLSDQQRIKGFNAGQTAYEVTDSFKPAPREPLQSRNPQQEINRLYDLVRTTLEGQSNIQSELKQIRQDMKQLARDNRTASINNSLQGEGSPVIKHHQLEMIRKSGGSPADRLYSNDYKEAIPMAKQYQHEKSLRPTDANHELSKAPGQEVSTTPFWHQSSRSNADTAHFNPKEDRDKAVFQKPQPSKRKMAEQQKSSRRTQLNQSQGIMTGKTTPKIGTSVTTALRKSPYIQKSGSKKKAQVRTKSAKPSERAIQPIQPPRGILKYPFYPSYTNQTSKANVQLPQHLQQLHRVYRNEKDELDRTCSYSDRSRSIRRSSKRRRVDINPSTRTAITEKIQRRLIDSKENFLDASHKNAKHQHTHLTNTVDLQRKLREDLLHRVHEMRDTKRYK